MSENRSFFDLSDDIEVSLVTIRGGRSRMSRCSCKALAKVALAIKFSSKSTCICEGKKIHVFVHKTRLCAKFVVT